MKLFDYNFKIFRKALIILLVGTLCFQVINLPVDANESTTQTSEETQEVTSHETTSTISNTTIEVSDSNALHTQTTQNSGSSEDTSTTSKPTTEGSDSNEQHVQTTQSAGSTALSSTTSTQTETTLSEDALSTQTTTQVQELQTEGFSFHSDEIRGSGTASDPYVMTAGETKTVTYNFGYAPDKREHTVLRFFMNTTAGVSSSVAKFSSPDGRYVGVGFTNMFLHYAYDEEDTKATVVVEAKEAGIIELRFEHNYTVTSIYVVVEDDRPSDEVIPQPSEDGIEPGTVSIDKKSAWVDSTKGQADITFALSGIPVETGTDVIIVLDRSGSMVENPTNWETAKSSVNTLIDGLLVEGANNRIAFVPFTGEGEAYDPNTYELDVVGSRAFTYDATSLKQYITNMEAIGGTNYTSALTKALEYAHETTGNGRALHVIMISDGQPGISGNGTGDTKWNGTIQAAELEELGAVVHTVAINVGGVISESGQNLLNNKIKSTEGLYFILNDVGELSQVLDQIEDQIKFAATDAVLTDVISEEFEIDMARFPDGVLPEGITIEGNTVTVDIGTISSDEKTVTIPIKLKDLSLAEGIYQTNDSAKLNYIDVDGNPAKKDDTTPIDNPDIEKPSLPVGKGYISIEYYLVNDSGQFINVDGIVVSKEFAVKFIREFAHEGSTKLNMGTYTVNGDDFLPVGYEIYTESLSFPVSYSRDITDVEVMHTVQFLVTEAPIVEYTIQYFDENETQFTELSPTTYIVGETTHLPQAMDMDKLRPGYEFLGWTITNMPEDVDYKTEISNTQTGNQIFYANWQRDLSQWHTLNYRVEYYVNNEMDSSKDVVGEEVLTSVTAVNVSNAEIEKSFDGYLVDYYSINGERVSELPKTVTDEAIIRVYYVDDLSKQLSVSATGYEGVYDGNAHDVLVGLPSATSKDGSTLIGEPTFYVSNSLNGEYVPLADFDMLTLKNVEDKVSIYVKAELEGYLTSQPIKVEASVTPKAVVITVADETIEFGQTPTFEIASIDGLIDANDLGIVSATYIGEVPTSVDSYPNQIEATYTANTNYKVSVVNADYTITKSTGRPEGGEVSVPEVNGTYNGSEYELSVEGLLEGDEVWYSVDGEEYTKTPPTVTDVDGSLPNITVKVTNPSYGDVNVDTSITVTAKEVVITVADETIEFGQTPTFEIASIDGLIDANDLGIVSATYIGEVPTDANVYVNKVSATYTANTNYKVNVENGDFTITKTNITVVNPENELNPYDLSESKEYDGSILDFNEEILIFEGVDGSITPDSVEYFVKDQEGNWQPVDEKDINAKDVKDTNEYKVVVKKENYEDVEIEFTLSVTPRNLTISVNDDSKVYGVQDNLGYQGYEITSGSIVESEELLIDVVRQEIGVEHGKLDVVGTYLEKLSALVEAGLNTDLSNYEVTVINGDYVIEKADVVIESITPEDPELEDGEIDSDDSLFTKVYDGTPLVFTQEDIKLSYNGEELSDYTVRYYLDEECTIEVTLEELSVLNVKDTKEIHVVISKDNFNTLKTSFTMEVTRRPVVIKVGDSNTKEGVSLSTTYLATLADMAITNATTTAKGNAIITEGDLGTASVLIDASIYGVVGNYVDHVGLTFMVKDEMITLGHGEPSHLINDNYDVMVHYGNLNIIKEIPVITPLPEETTSTTTTTTTATSTTTTTGSDEMTTIEQQGSTSTTNPMPTQPTQPTEVKGESEEERGIIEEVFESIFGEEETPLFGSSAHWSLFNLLVALFSTIISLGLIVDLLRKNKEEEENSEHVVHDKRLLRFTSILVAFVSIILFVVTQNTKLQVAWLDQWSILFLIIMIIQISIALFSKREVDEEEKPLDYNAM